MTIFVSFATPAYHLEACSLVQSLEVLGLPYHVAMVPSEGDWVDNCARKAEVMLGLHGDTPLCWVDADARVIRPPSLLGSQAMGAADVAWHTFEGHPASGTVWVAGGPAGHRFLKAWRQACEWNRGTWDQRLLETALVASGARHYELPPEYCFIYDHSRRHWPDAQPVIEHYQASRRLK